MAAPVKLGLLITTVPATAVIEVARAAEEMGYDDVWLGEHFALHRDDWWVDDSQVVARRKAGQQVGPGDAHVKAEDLFEDAMIMLAGVAAATTRIRLGLGIYLLALRHPILAAKTMITLDRLSAGRLEMTVGLGWSPGEFAALGVDWNTRAKRYDESLEAVRVLLRDEWPEYHGEHFDFGPIGFEPKPLRDIPIRLGGGPVGARRAALTGDGWFGSPDLFDDIRRIRAEAGLTNPFDFVSLSIFATPSRQQLDELAAKGADKVAVAPLPRFVSVDDCIDRMERYAKESGLL